MKLNAFLARIFVRHPPRRTHAVCPECGGEGCLLHEGGGRSSARGHTPEEPGTLIRCGTCGGSGELACTRPLDDYEGMHQTGRAP